MSLRTVFAAMTKPSHAQNTYFHRDPFPNRRGDVRLSSRGAFSPSVVLVVVPYWR